MIKQSIGAIAVIVVGIALAILIGSTGPRGETLVQPSTTVEVQTITAVKQTVTLELIAHGTVLPKTESSLVAEVPGRVTAVSPSLVAGGFFKKGDVLAEIERIDYRLALEQAKAQLVSIQSELTVAEKEFERLEPLTQQQHVSESQVDAAFSRRAIARASLREALAREDRAERDLERTRLVAPYAGRVRSERVDVGQYLNRGESIAAIYAIDYAEVRLPISDEDLAFLPSAVDKQDASNEGLKVALRARFSGAERLWEGEIVRTEGELDPQTRMVNLIAQVKSPYAESTANPPLTLGLFVEAAIESAPIDDVVIVPRSALRADDRVYVLNADNRLEFRDVEIIRTVGDVVYIGKGIESGETICVSDIETPVEGQLLKPKSRANPSSS